MSRATFPVMAAQGGLFAQGNRSKERLFLVGYRYWLNGMPLVDGSQLWQARTHDAECSICQTFHYLRGVGTVSGGVAYKESKIPEAFIQVQASREIVSVKFFDQFIDRFEMSERGRDWVNDLDRVVV